MDETENELLKTAKETNVKDLIKKFDSPSKIIKAVDDFSDRPPHEQLKWWWLNFYKPFVVSIAPSLLAAAFIGLLMKLTGTYTNFEVGIMIVLVFISSRINNACNILLRIEKKLEENKHEDKQMPALRKERDDVSLD
jgi:hypothetical protein